jgi:phenylacetate-CoA ligase
VTAGFYTGAVSAFLFPLQERLKKHDSVAMRRALEVSQWWDRERLQTHQAKRLRSLLRHAAEHVPYYRDLYGRIGFKVGDATGPADLGRLPFLEKADIRANLEALKSERARNLIRFNTGGSTGEPLIFYLGPERVSHDVAAKWRATRWWGVDIGDPEIVVWGSPIELGAQDRMRALRDALMRTELLSAFEMSEAKLDDFVARIRRRRPKMLFGYPSALAHIARHAERRGVVLDELGVKVAFVTAEKLYDEQRSAIERVFGCRVAEGYGSREGGFIAHQCPAGGVHISAEDVIVEVVDESGSPLGPGQAGEIVVTHLASRDFPFIRYRTGDVGVLSGERCECGRGLPLLTEIQGRTTDFVVARDGTVMHGLALIYVVRDVPGVRQFKVVQESLERTRVLLATDGGFRDRDLETIRGGIGRRLGNGVRVDIERVAEIPTEASGKYRYVVSHVAADRSVRPSSR